MFFHDFLNPNGRLNCGIFIRGFNIETMKGKWDLINFHGEIIPAIRPQPCI